MVKFSPDFLDSLAPRDQVFEIKEDRDFAFRVFPNGSKTWVFICGADHCVQRRTLGIYPQMGLEQAREALREARETTRAKEVQTAGEDAEPGQKPKTPPARNTVSVLSGTLAIAIIAGFLGMGTFLILPAVEDLQPANVDSPKTSGFVKDEAPLALAYSSEKAELAQPAPLGGLPRAVSTGEAQIAEPEIPTTALKPRSASPKVATVAPSTKAPAVKRAQFTHGIENREPVDRISKTLSAWDRNEGARPIFFFTEVAGLGGRTIYHRWELNGRVISEIPFDVKSSWRWRVFSSKNILPTMAGRWRVTVVDDLDNVLYSQEVKLSPKHLMSASNLSDGTAQSTGGR